MSGWCLVVAGDRKGPGRYEIPRGQVVFLSHERQEELAQHIPFVQRMPWNHFARKNVAYLYAIANGAEYIWDFDDDNDLMPGKLLNAYTNQDPSTPQQVLQVDNRNNTACQVYNPYSFFQPSALGIWPRGYPRSVSSSPKQVLIVPGARPLGSGNHWPTVIQMWTAFFDLLEVMNCR